MISAQLARHFREVYFGVNWTWVNLKNTLEGVTWQQATTQVHSLNTIATLVYHIHYFVRAASKVLAGGPLEGHDKYSFDHPPITNAQEWESFLDTVWYEAETFVKLIEQLPDEMLWQIFSEEKYGTYYRNIQGIIEHSHYHLGQIAFIKKMVAQGLRLFAIK